jgi:alkylation response protein AidB-like acyl-CoA dehydrogenase
MRCLHAKDLSFKPRMSFDIYEPLAEFSADVTGAGPDEHGQLPETGLAPFLVGASAELMGIGERCLGETIQFVKERSQFGKRIGSYQSLKHRLADCYVEIENTRTAVHYAALSWDSKSADSWTSANIARAYSALTIPRVIEACVQAHGAFGFTWESGLHVMLRRARKRAALLYSGKRAQMMLEDRLACNDIGADLQV